MQENEKDLEKTARNSETYYSEQTNNLKQLGNNGQFSVVPYNDNTRLLSQIATNHYEKNIEKKAKKQEQDLREGKLVAQQLSLPIFEAKTFNLKDATVTIEPTADLKQFDNKRFQTHLVLGKLYEANKNCLRYEKLPVIHQDGTTTEGKAKLYLILTLDELREAYGYTGKTRTARQKDKETIQEQINYFANLKINYKYTQQYVKKGKGRSSNSIVRYLETPKGKVQFKSLEYSYTFLDGYCSIVNNNLFYIPFTQEYLNFLKSLETGSRFLPNFLLKNCYVDVNTLGHFLVNYEYQGFENSKKSFNISVDSIYKYTNLPTVETVRKEGLLSGNYYKAIVNPFIRKIELLRKGGEEEGLFKLFISDKDGNPIDTEMLTATTLFDSFIHFEWLEQVEEN